MLSPYDLDFYTFLKVYHILYNKMSENEGRIKIEIKEEPQSFDESNLLEDGEKCDIKNENLIKGYCNSVDSSDNFEERCHLFKSETKQEINAEDKPNLIEIKSQTDGALKSESKNVQANFKCTKCKFQTKYRPSFYRHRNMHNNRLYGTLITFQNHLKTYNCDHCAFQSTHKYHFYQHSLLHRDPSEIPMFECHTCQFKTKYKSHLNTHMLVHRKPEEVRVHRCPKCKSKFKHPSSLNKHKLEKHNLKGDYFTCELCSFRTKHLYNLRVHVESHMKANRTLRKIGVKSCKLCPFKSKYPSLMVGHLKLVHKNGDKCQLNERNNEKPSYRKPKYLKKKIAGKHTKNNNNNNDIWEPQMGSNELKDVLPESLSVIKEKPSRIRKKPNYLKDYVEEFKDDIL